MRSVRVGGHGFGPDFFGHGGAQATAMEVRTKDGLVVVWMVQHQGFPGKGGQAQGETESGGKTPEG